MKYAIPALILLGAVLAGPLESHAAQTGENHRPRPKFADCDTNKDGLLSREEFLGCWPRGAEKFAVMDKNGDGLVSKEDMQAWRAERRAARQANGTGGGNAGRRQGFAECDTNKDGFLSKEDFLGCWPRGAEKFAAMDKNGDGLVSKDDMKAWRVEHRAERQSRPARHEDKAAE